MQSLVIRRAAAIVVAIWLPYADLVAADWPMFAGDTSRSSIAARVPPSIQSPRWIAHAHPDEEFVFAATPVAAGGRVVTNARVFANSVHVANRLIAYHAATGQRLWHADTPPDTLDSWSSPVIDVRTGIAILASGSTITAFDLAGGDPLWTTSLPQSVVNASPLVTYDLSSGSTPANRVILTTYSPFSTGNIIAINVDPYDAADNPFQLGEIAWSAALFRLSGNTPAYENGEVYCSSVAGSLHAFDAASGAPIWSRSIGTFTFFAGLSLRDGHAYAASYNVSGGQNNSRLVKLRLADQAVIWTTPCERTDATPVVAPDGRIYLSGGIHGFGSATKLQAFQDHGSSVSLLWDTWQTSGGTWNVGGWTAQPLLAGNRLIIGAPPGASEPWGPFAMLYALNLDFAPTDPAFVESQCNGAGGSCAAWNGWLYSIGVAGLHGFAPPRRAALPPQPNTSGARHIATEGFPWTD